MYVDDLCIAAHDPEELINILRTKYKLKVKGDGPLTYHLGAGYYHDEPVYLYSLFYVYMFLVIASLANLHTHAFPIRAPFILNHNIIIRVFHSEFRVSYVLRIQRLLHQVQLSPRTSVLSFYVWPSFGLPRQSRSQPW